MLSRTDLKVRPFDPFLLRTPYISAQAGL